MISNLNNTIDKGSCIKLWQRLVCFLVGVGAGLYNASSSKPKSELERLAFEAYSRFDMNFFNCIKYVMKIIYIVFII